MSAATNDAENGGVVHHHEAWEANGLKLEDAQANQEVVAEGGHAATDRYGGVTVQLDAKAEKRLRHKIDRYVAPSFPGNARLAGFEADLNMANWDFNTSLCMFYVAYIVFEHPCMFLCKLMGPGLFPPGATFLFGLFTVCLGLRSY